MSDTNREDCSEVLTRDEYEANQHYRQELLQLRRAQDRKLIELCESSLDLLTERLSRMEETLNRLDGSCRERQSTFRAYEKFQERTQVRLEKHEEAIGELKTGYASVKAWILIVGGITGVASFLAIVLR